MRRRRVLTAAGISVLPVSGCVSDNGGDGTTEASTPDEGRSVSVSLTHESGPEDIGFDYDVRRSAITDASPAVIELTARNETESDIEYGTGAPKPFGALSDPDTPEAVLWTDEYAESRHVRTSGRRITEIEDVGLTVALSAGESRSETYEFTAAPGRYPMKRTGNPLTLGTDTYGLEIAVSEP